MESRRPLHYKGNTLKKQNVDNVGDKIFARSRCNICGHKFEDYSIICPRCKNCQNCGLLNRFSDHCIRCNNKLPDQFKRKRKRFVI